MFSKTAQYTFRILIFMSQKEDALFSATHIHEETKIPYKYLTMLLTKLAKANILKATRGRNGGFLLNKNTDTIYLVEILDAIDENDCNNCALGESACNVDNPCSLHEAFSPAKTALVEMLTNTTLSQLDPSLMKSHQEATASIL
nr:Rrf2 family transcriptional regulator [Sulfurimonas sp. MAG313]